MAPNEIKKNEGRKGIITLSEENEREYMVMRSNDQYMGNSVEDALMAQVTGAAIFKGPYDQVALLLKNLDRLAPKGVSVVYRRYSAGFLKVVAEEETRQLRH